MRAVSIVTWDELKRNWLVFPGALLMGVLALISPFAPGMQQWNPETVREVSTLVVALAVMAFASIVLGSAILGGSLSSGRESFFLARPIGVFQLWLGRLIAALMLSLGAPMLVLIPLACVHPAATLAFLRRPSPVPWLLLLLPGVIAMAGLVRIMLRARSAWLALTAGTVAGALFIQAHMIVMPLAAFMLHVDGAVRYGVLATLPLVWSVSFLAGGAVAAVRGRTEARRAAAAGGVTAVTALGVLTLALCGGLAWVDAPAPADITQVAMVVPAPEGNWALVAAQARRAGITFPVTFLLDTTSGAWRRWSGTWWQLGGEAPFSRDGRFAAWWEDRETGASRLSGHIRVVALPSVQPRTPKTVRVVPAPLRPSGFGLALSPSGSMLAAVFGLKVSVWDLRSGRRVTTRTVGREFGGLLRVEWLRVSDTGDVWLGMSSHGTGARGRMKVVSLHLGPTGRHCDVVWEESGVAYLSRRMDTAAGGPGNVVALAIGDGGKAGHLVVRRTGKPNVVWSRPLEGLWPVRQILPFGEQVMLLVSRSVPASTARLGSSIIARVEPMGVTWVRTVQKVSWLMLGPGPDPGTAVVVINRHPGSRVQAPSCMQLSLQTGAMTPVGSNLLPAAVPWVVSPLPAPGSPGSRLFIRNRCMVLRLSEAGRLTPIAIQ